MTLVAAGASSLQPGAAESCVRALAAAQVPLLLTHGLADVTVDPGASRAIYEAATGPKSILWLDGADHQCRTRFDELLGALSGWLPALVQRFRRGLRNELSDGGERGAAGEREAVPDPWTVELERQLTMTRLEG